MKYKGEIIDKKNGAHGRSRTSDRLVRSQVLYPAELYAHQVFIFINDLIKMAEKEGFEPSMGFKAHTPLAGERLRPLGHLSVSWRTYYCLKKISQTISYKGFLIGAFLNRLNK